jgi:uridylate kinase
MMHVISVGGSIIAPDKVDTVFLKDFSSLIVEFIRADKDERFILVAGGGSPARVWQNAYREIAGEAFIANEADWIGVAATRLNAELLRAALFEWAPNPVVLDPSAVGVWGGRVLVSGGWKPGFSSDYDAVLLASRFGADTVVNLSNIAKVYTADPKLDPDAKPIDSIGWSDFRKIVGTEWVPGKNVPFDPVASALAEKENVHVICAQGRNIDNTRKILRGENFSGPTIG